MCTGISADVWVTTVCMYVCVCVRILQQQQRLLRLHKSKPKWHRVKGEGQTGFLGLGSGTLKCLTTKRPLENGRLYGCVCVCETRGPKAISGDSWKLGRSQPERQKIIQKWNRKTFANTCKLLQVFLLRLNARMLKVYVCVCICVCLYLYLYPNLWRGWTSCHRDDGECFTSTYLNSLNFNSKTLIFYENSFLLLLEKGYF